MEPWEQHHSVVSMPRYAYNSGAILQRNAAGFLITCPFRREKSATKEFLGLLREYMTLTEDCGRAQPDIGSTGAGPETCQRSPHSHDGNEDSKFQFKPTLNDTPRASNGAEANSDAVTPSIRDRGRIDPLDNTSDPADSRRKVEGADEKPAESDATDGVDENYLASDSKVFPVKLSAIGLIFICVPGKAPSVLLDVASKILKDTAEGKISTPKWCNRVYPVQGTCAVKKEELQKIVSHLIKDHLQHKGSSLEETIDYAVAFNKRGDGTARSSRSGGTDSPVALGRHDCIEVVASVVEQVSKTIRVNLSSPKMVVLVELIPVSGIDGSLVCAVSVLPGHMTISKPKLNIKPLAPLVPMPKKRKRFTEKNLTDGQSD